MNATATTLTTNDRIRRDRLIRFIKSHGTEAWDTHDGKILAIEKYSDGSEIEVILPIDVRKVREFLGY